MAVCLSELSLCSQPDRSQGENEGRWQPAEQESSAGHAGAGWSAEPGASGALLPLMGLLTLTLKSPFLMDPGFTLKLVRIMWTLVY